MATEGSNTKIVYRVTLWHGDGKGSTWHSDKPPKLESSGVFRFKCQDGQNHWITGNVEITEFEQPA